MKRMQLHTIKLAHITLKGWRRFLFIRLQSKIYILWKESKIYVSPNTQHSARLLSPQAYWINFVHVTSSPPGADAGISRWGGSGVGSAFPRLNFYTCRNQKEGQDIWTPPLNLLLFSANEEMTVKGTEMWYDGSSGDICGQERACLNSSSPLMTSADSANC